ncbi:MULTISPECIES: hypothetical protein [Williamsia]|uniref:Transmembrane protein n=1 Tax=Williamsia marianensis TaxID=85044 RepID=A0ABU4EV22_WILMA|nr:MULTISPECIES: hypothetical protein [Williamsia]ETD33463.1 hypothetical protein W823_08095 [Williamsia sp. D3]MDV7135091.1 hypothetical protein [Williamsia muralis]PVY29923.1 hypothetical protein C7458_105167 [Williamsia marianensis]
MSTNGPFGFEPEDFDRFAREAGEGFRDMLGQVAKGMSQSGGENPLASLLRDSMFSTASQRTKPAPPTRETTGDTGDGVWAIYTVAEDGSARIDQVYASELDALRAHKDNVDPQRRVRFLPYGVSVGVLDDSGS